MINVVEWLWHMLVLVETILIYSRVNRNMTCKNHTSES